MVFSASSSWLFPLTCSQPAVQGPSSPAAQPERGAAAGGAEPPGVDAGRLPEAVAHSGPAEGEPAGRQAAALGRGAAGDGLPGHWGGVGEEEPHLGSRGRPAARQVSDYEP